MLGHYDAALASLRLVRPDLLTPDAAVAVTDMNLPILVAHVLNRRGDTAQAARLLERVLAATAPVAGQRTPNDWRIVRAKVFAERGQTAETLKELDAAVAGGWRTPFLFDDSLQIEDLPSMASLRGNPRFKSLMVKVRQDLAKQRAAVLAMRR